MKITTNGEYGLRCVLRIARAHSTQPVSVNEISSAEKLSRDYVEQILLRLRRGGLLRSVRGIKGGYILTRPPEEIRVSDVLNILESPLFEDSCRHQDQQGHNCVHLGDCSVRPLWQLLSTHIAQLLDEVHLDVLLNDEHTVQKCLAKR